MAIGSRARFIVLAVFGVVLFAVFFLHGHSLQPGQPLLTTPKQDATGGKSGGAQLIGHAIAPKLGNATIKAELGRAAWKLLHTTFARFPEKPSDEEKEALRSYVHLFQRLYPCGECAEHFGLVLAKFPPQVSSRTAAAMWGCMVHNLINQRLMKPEFKCEDIGDAYDCGCADDDGKPGSTPKGEDRAWPID